MQPQLFRLVLGFRYLSIGAVVLRRTSLREYACSGLLPCGSTADDDAEPVRDLPIHALPKPLVL